MVGGDLWPMEEVMDGCDVDQVRAAFLWEVTFTASGHAEHGLDAGCAVHMTTIWQVHGMSGLDIVVARVALKRLIVLR